MTYESKRLYRPLPPPQGDIRQIALWMYRELQRASEALEQSLTVPISYAEPSRPQEGQIVYADGTNWNPGSGAGIYAYLSSTWTKL